jgi:hypothetical protein
LEFSGRNIYHIYSITIPVDTEVKELSAQLKALKNICDTDLNLLMESDDAFPPEWKTK